MSRPTGQDRASTSRRQKARHQLGRIREHLLKGNIVLEVRDARAPRTTDPSRLVTIPEGRVRCVVLTKADLADPAATAAWEAHFRKLGMLVLAVDQSQPKQAGKALKRLLATAAGRAKTVLGVGRAVVVGLPNVGKSTLINRLVGRGALRTGDRPGVTKGESWAKIDSNLYLLDTPGVIEAMNRLVDADPDGATLALLRVAPTSLLDAPAAARRLLARGATSWTLPAGVDPALPPLEGLARRWNRLLQDGVPDLATTAELALKEMASGAWGRVSLERPDDPTPGAEG